MNRRNAVPAVLVWALAACSDQLPPVAPAIDGAVALRRGGAPTPVAPPAPDLDEVTSAICGFPLVHQVSGREKYLEFPNGRTIGVFPGNKVTWTNGNTGRTVTRSTTGALHITPLPDGNTQIVLTGHTPVYDDVEGYYEYLSGRFTVVIGPDGSIVQPLDGNGRRVDVCALLAD